MHIRGLIPYFCGLMIGLGKKLMHVVPSGSPSRLLEVSQSVAFKNMNSTHVYAFDHGESNGKIKK